MQNNFTLKKLVHRPVRIKNSVGLYSFVYQHIRENIVLGLQIIRQAIFEVIQKYDFFLLDPCVFKKRVGGGVSVFIFFSGGGSLFFEPRRRCNRLVDIYFCLRHFSTFCGDLFSKFWFWFCIYFYFCCIFGTPRRSQPKILFYSSAFSFALLSVPIAQRKPAYESISFPQ